MHRDLKPENVFIAETDDGEVAKLLDFGIARKGGGSSLTHSGALMGTPAYMAPEQVAGNRGEVGAWSDVYAMGVILYEMLTGKAPFAADSMTEVLSKVLSREFAPLRSVRAGLPEAVYQLCERTLADDPASRFPHADALREAWQAAYGSFPADVRNATVPRFRAPAAADADMANAPTSHATATGTPAPGTPPPPSGPMTPAIKKASPTSFAATQATPSPVVGESKVDPASQNTRSSRGLALIIGGVLLAGMAAVLVVIASGGDGGGGPRDAGMVATASDATTAPPPDAAVAIPSTIDASLAPPGMVRLPGGRFTMGADPAIAAGYPDALAQQATEVGPFLIDQHEMTAVAAKSALGLTPGPKDAPGLPARAFHWADAARVCKLLGKRLPTEAEWEFAAQRSPLSAAGAQLKAPGVKGPAAVGSHPADCTSDGVCDLLGNVLEWTSDGAGARRIVRGGSFNVSATERWWATIHARQAIAATAADGEIGFRCAADGGPP